MGMRPHAAAGVGGGRVGVRFFGSPAQERTDPRQIMVLSWKLVARPKRIARPVLAGVTDDGCDVFRRREPQRNQRFVKSRTNRRVCARCPGVGHAQAHRRRPHCRFGTAAGGHLVEPAPPRSLHATPAVEVFFKQCSCKRPSWPSRKPKPYPWACFGSPRRRTLPAGVGARPGHRCIWCIRLRNLCRPSCGCG